jgi:hypothetical protein
MQESGNWYQETDEKIHFCLIPDKLITEQLIDVQNNFS